MTAAVALFRHTDTADAGWGVPVHARAGVAEYDPLRETRHPHARAAREQAEWLLWLEARELRPRTVADYAWATDFLLGQFPDTPFSEFTESHLAAVLKRWHGETRRTRQFAYDSLFSWGYIKGHIDTNPVSGLPRPRKQPQKYIETFNEAERAALTGLPNPDGILMLLLLETGLRKGEARRLRVRHLKIEQRELIVFDGKGGKDRVVRMSMRLQRGLADFLLTAGLGPNDYLWYSKPGGGRIRRTTPLHETGFVRWWARCCKAAEVDYVPKAKGIPGRGNPHVTRHTFATEWLRDGGRLLTLSKVLGHASIKTTADLYGHLDQQDIAADFDLIEAKR